MWTVILSQTFDDWLEEQDDATQEKVLADLSNLEVYGPSLARPYADTVKGSRHKNMKFNTADALYVRSLPLTRCDKL
jgi:hypothetical protein